MQGTVHQINVNPKGGVPKHRIDSTRIELDHVAGDKQRNLKVHGGPLRAVCLYSLELIHKLNEEGHPIKPGDIGENLTLAGIDWNALPIGSRLKIGDEVQLEITSHTIPCANINFAFCKNSTRVSQELHPGWSRLYAKVLKTGLIRIGDSVRVES